MLLHENHKRRITVNNQMRVDVSEVFIKMKGWEGSAGLLIKVEYHKTGDLALHHTATDETIGNTFFHVDLFEDLAVVGIIVKNVCGIHR